MRWVQSGLGLLTCIGLFFLGNRIGDALKLNWVGCISMLAYGLYPSVLLFEQDWLTPALSNALVVFGILGIVHPKKWSLLLGGLSLGCAISVHPSLLLLGGASLYWGWKHAQGGFPFYSAFVWRSHPLSFGTRTMGHLRWCLTIRALIYT